MRNHKCTCGETNPENFYGSMYSRCKACDDAQKTARRLERKRILNEARLATGNYYTDTAGRVRPNKIVCESAPKVPKPVNQELLDLEHALSTIISGSLADMRYLFKEKIKSARKRARKKEKEFTIDYKTLLRIFIAQRGFCKYTGVLLSPTNPTKFMPSLDRIDSTIGYTESNCQFVATVINTMKSDMPEELFLKVCERVTNSGHLSTTKIHS